MPSDLINDIHIESEKVLMTPAQLRESMPISQSALDFVLAARNTVSDICQQRDHRLLVISGPCSIHDMEQAKTYALGLKALQDKYREHLYIVMRVYFEKPRTTVGWKGFINDPHMDNSFDVEQGLKNARELLTWAAELGLPTATEALDPLNPQYISELITWSAIGARTTESQTHREMASGLSMPVGFKNGTDGSLATAINAMQSAAASHRFIGINQNGQVALLTTQGNPDGHVILRGGKQPNYDAESVTLAEQAMHKAGLKPSIVVDCSHANSSKDHNRQPLVALNVAEQIKQGNQSIIGIMLESHLHAGNQSADLPKAQLKYGVSITDACIDWETTVEIIEQLNRELAVPLQQRHAAKLEQV